MVETLVVILGAGVSACLLAAVVYWARNERIEAGDGNAAAQVGPLDPDARGD